MKSVKVQRGIVSHVELHPYSYFLFGFKMLWLWAYPMKGFQDKRGVHSICDLRILVYP
jgi:hypothetical protein